MIYIGYDETNHGSPYELGVAVSSELDLDSIELLEKLGKKRSGDLSRRISKLNSRDYSFVLFTDSDNARLNYPFQKLGVIVGSLLYDEPINEEIRIFVDGVWQKESIKFAKKSISYAVGLEKKMIKIQCGRHLDRRYSIVNFADTIAYYLLDNSLRKLSSDSHRKKLIIEEFIQDNLLEQY